MMENPPVTVLMAVFNAEEYLPMAIESILNQTYTEFEFIIVDDKSTDSSLEIIKSYQQKDSRIKLICREENGGLSKALNTGLKEARGKYIARIDADDIATPERLKVQYNFMETNSEYVAVGSGIDYIDKDGNFIYRQPRETNPSKIEEKIFEACPIPHTTAFFKKNIAEKCNNYYEPIRQYFEDHLLFSKMIKYGKITNLDAYLMKYRLVPTSITSNKDFDREYLLIRNEVLKNGFITPSKQKKLFIIKSHKTTNDNYKKCMYHLYIAKKFLWNRYQPKEARIHILQAISSFPMKYISYPLWILSFTPERLIKKLYNTAK